MTEKIISRDALIDERPAALKIKDYSRYEVRDDTAAAVVPFQNKRIEELSATEYNQWYVGSCVPHAFLTQLEYEGFIPKSGLSQLRAYRKRSNYPNPGSAAVDMYEQIRSGQSDDFPTPPRFTEAEATAMPYVLGTKRIDDFRYYQYLNSNGYVDLAVVPADVAKGKAVSVFIYASDNEWSNEYVEATDTVNLYEAEVRHSVVLIPHGDFTEDGKQWFSVHDSAWFGGRSLRYVSYDFLKARCYMAAQVRTVDEVAPQFERPLPTSYCEFGQTSDAVLNLQTFLIKDGKLGSQYNTGYYGALTAKAVLWWQLEHYKDFTSDIPTLLKWGGKYWGEQSIGVLNNDQTK